MNPSGFLRPYYNNNVNFVKTDELVTAATLPSKNTFRHLLTFVKQRKFNMLFGAICALFNYFIFKKNMNQERQKFWSKYNDYIPGLKDNYDLAFGILGLSTYFIVDKVEASKKFHWIRSDTRILNRDIDIDGKYYKKINGALSVSRECADIFVEMFPFMKGSVEVFYNYIPESFYKKIDYNKSLIETNKNYIKIITVTRLDPLKGIEMAIDACRCLTNKGYKIKWYVIGDGKYRTEVEKLINDNGIQDSFILLGFQLNTLAFIEKSDIFVHPSRSEGKSNAVDEAKFVGKPIVVTNYATVSEQIEDGVTGLISDMTGKDVASSVEKIINNKNLTKELIENCKNDRHETLDPTTFFKELSRVRGN